MSTNNAVIDGHSLTHRVTSVARWSDRQRRECFSDEGQGLALQFSWETSAETVWKSLREVYGT